MNFLFILVFLTAFNQDSLSIQDKTIYQIEKSIEEINKGKNVDWNLWAINEIATINCKNFNLVKEKSYNIPSDYNFLIDKTCSPSSIDDLSDLHVYYSSDHVKNAYNSFIKERQTISNELLSFKENFIIHYKLQVEPSEIDYEYEENYQTDALEHWVSLLRNEEYKNDLELSILASLVVRLSFKQDRYDLIEEFDSLFLSLNKLPYTLDQLRLLGALDYTYYRYSKFSSSLALLRNYSIPLAEYLNENSILNSLKNRQGAYLIALGKYENSKNIYEQIYNDSLSISQQYTLYTNLGISYFKLGESNKYLSLQLKALENEIENPESKLTIYRNLMSFYTSIKDVSSVMNYFELAKDLAREVGDKTEMAYIDFYLASFYWNTLKDHNQALKFISSAEKDLNVTEEYDMYIDLLLEKGYIFNQIGENQKALQVFEKTKELALQKSDTPNYIDALVSLTEIHLKNNELDQAQANLSEISLYPRDNLDFELLVKFFTVKADYLSKSNNNRQAIEDIQPVITQVIDRAKNNTDSQQGYWTIEDEYLDAFQLALKLYLEENELQNALTVLEQFKTINDASLYNSPLVKANKLTEEELAEEKLLSERLQSLRNKYLNASDADRFEIKRQMDQVSAQREQILSNVELDKEDNLPSLWKLQRSIDPTELVLHFTEIGDLLYVSRVTMNDIKIKSLPLMQQIKRNLIKLLMTWLPVLQTWKIFMNFIISLILKFQTKPN